MLVGLVKLRTIAISVSSCNGMANIDVNFDMHLLPWAHILSTYHDETWGDKVQGPIVTVGSSISSVVGKSLGPTWRIWHNC
jgi:hypothetical protein